MKRPTEGVDLRAAAEEWMNGHPAVMKLFERFAAAIAARGRTFGVGLLTERVRWECAFEYGGDGDEYKINNNHRAYIARRLVLEHPELAPLMRFRETRY